MRAPDTARRTADRLSLGSAILARRLGERFAARCRRWRRGDLSGIKAALGPLLLLALAAGALYVVAGIVRARPWLMWLLTGAWCLAAWRAAKPTVEASQTAPDDAPASPAENTAAEVYDATLTWVWQMVGDRQGVHLRDLLANAQQADLFEGLDVAALRAHLEEWGIPVRKRVRVRGLGVTLGIHRDDLPAPSQPLPDEGGPGEPTGRLHAA
ncbi:hypothetical protein ABZ820_34735 [Streptomyces diacarni]|uniref:hypothetical protein n=1 Tax=Streptomyces diacarni TaxID=2800381 RepID=UPI003405CA26